MVDRANSDLKRRIINYLVSRHVPALRHVEVEAVAGTVILRGKLRSFYHKQLCLHCCQRVAGVIKLIDELVVDSSQDASITLAHDG